MDGAEDEQGDGVRRPSPAMLVITPAAANPHLRYRRPPPPVFPAEGAPGEYVSDTGPLLAAGVVPRVLRLVRERFRERLVIPEKVEEELQRLANGSNVALERAAAAEVLKLVADGWPTVIALTADEQRLAEGRLLQQLTALPPELAGTPGGQHIGECHALALALRYGSATTILLTNDGRAGRLARINGISARSITGLLREVSLTSDDGYSPEDALHDFGLMQAVSSPPGGDRPRGPEAFR